MKTKRTQPPRQQWCIDPPNLPSMQCAGTRACRVSSKQWILSPPPWLCLSPRPLSRYIDHSPSENRSTAPNFRGKISGATCSLLYLPISLFLPRYISNFLSCPKSACPTFIESLRTIDYADFIGFFDYFRAIRDDLIRITSSSYLREIAAGYYRNSLKDIFSFPKSPVSNIRNGDNKIASRKWSNEGEIKIGENEVNGKKNTEYSDNNNQSARMLGW